jgi:hypothetical protein
VRQERRADRGAVLVETMLALPVLALLLLGTIEVGALMRTSSTAANAVRAAGRMASVAGADPMTDQMVLKRFAIESQAIGQDRVQLLVIWHASGPGTTVPPACLPPVGSGPSTTSTGVSDGGLDTVGACNAYINPDLAGGAFAMAKGTAAHPPEYYFGCQGSTDPAAAQKVDCRWPGKNRRAVTTPRTSGVTIPPDFVGIYVRVLHRLPTAIVLKTVTITDSSINLIEPLKFSFT